jgi:hypothetical protein
LSLDDLLKYFEARTNVMLFKDSLQDVDAVDVVEERQNVVSEWHNDVFEVCCARLFEEEP